MEAAIFVAAKARGSEAWDSVCLGRLSDTIVWKVRLVTSIEPREGGKIARVKSLTI